MDHIEQRERLKTEVQASWVSINRSLTNADVPITEKIKALAGVHDRAAEMLDNLRGADYDAKLAGAANILLQNLYAAKSAADELLSLVRDTEVTKEAITAGDSYASRSDISLVSFQSQVAAAVATAQKIAAHFHGLIPDIVERIGSLPDERTDDQ